MIQLHVTMTSKGYHPSKKWQMFAEYTHSFKNKEGAKEWLVEFREVKAVTL